MKFLKLFFWILALFVGTYNSFSQKKSNSFFFKKKIDSIYFNSKNYQKKYTIHHAPLYFVDGKETTEKSIYLLSPSTIERIVVLKNKKAISKYGLKGKFGVIEIYLKNKE